MCSCYLCAFITVSWIFHSKAGAPLAFVTVGYSIGTFVFPYVYEALIRQYGWRGTFLLVGAITLHCLPIGVLFSTSRRFYRNEGETDINTRIGNSNATLFKDPVVILFVLNVFTFSTTGETSVVEHVIVILRQRLYSLSLQKLV